MPIDPIDDELIPLPDVPKLLPKPVSLTTLQRWWKYGIRGVRLETVKVAQTRYTTKDALRRYFKERTQQDVHDDNRIVERSDERRQALIDAGLI